MAGVGLVWNFSMMVLIFVSIWSMWPRFATSAPWWTLRDRYAHCRVADSFDGSERSLANDGRWRLPPSRDYYSLFDWFVPILLFSLAIYTFPFIFSQYLFFLLVGGRYIFLSFPHTVWGNTLWKRIWPTRTRHERGLYTRNTIGKARLQGKWTICLFSLNFDV